jgi:hypothetical protein
MVNNYVIRIISRGSIKIEGRAILSAASKQKVKKQAQKMYPNYKIISIKKKTDEILDF